MSYWNYRIVRQKFDNTNEEFFSLFEIYYNKKDKIKYWYAEPTVHGINIKDLKLNLKLMKRALKLPIIKFEDLPGYKEYLKRKLNGS